ncbi:hypothetical protein J6590_081870 [Homalodisca vitripennis]|nr:hypothetical protein J6590_081870 [Homalodisca vitripennis]
MLKSQRQHSEVLRVSESVYLIANYGGAPPQATSTFKRQSNLEVWKRRCRRYRLKLITREERSPPPTMKPTPSDFYFLNMMQYAADIPISTSAPGWKTSSTEASFNKNLKQYFLKHAFYSVDELLDGAP